MKKLFIVLVLAVILFLQAVANPISISQAKGVAEQFLQRSSLMKAPALSGSESLTLAYSSPMENGTSDYYVFNRSNGGGFIIVAGDDCVLPVLGYSDNGVFDFDQLPENLEWWLGEYQREIRFAQSIAATPRQMPILDSSVAPLMKTTWDQGAPYNNFCPTYHGGNDHAVTGCVATAVAQIMKTHDWPPVGEGSVTYDCNVNGEPATTLSADFSQIEFDWGNMRNNYGFGNSSQTQKDAVATLMSAVGIAVEMMYGASSGAYSIKALEALRDHFRYDKGIAFKMRDFMPLDEWEQMLRDELDAGRPIYYAGASNHSGGHAFVFDGYNKDGYFHVNWGWGGRSDGYFACTALNPSSSPAGFNSSQEVIVGIQPDNGGTPVLQPLQGYLSYFMTKTPNAHLGDEVALRMDDYTFLGEGDISQLDFAATLLDETGTQMLASLHITDVELMKGYTYYFGDDEPVSLTLPENLSAGTYRLVAVYSLDGMQTTIPFVRPADSAGYVEMTVTANGMVTFRDADAPQGILQLMKNIEPEALSMPADDIHASALVKAVGGFYDGELTAQVLTKNAGEYQVIGTANTNVSIHHVGEQKVVNFLTSVTAQEGDTCYVAIVNPEEGTSYWGEPQAFVIGEWPEPVPSFLSPTNDKQFDFGKVLKGTTKVDTMMVKGENLKGNVILSITGPNASRFRVNPATITSTNAMKGASVTVIYSALVVGDHEAQLLISGGGVEEGLSIPLSGSTCERGDINADGMIDVEDVNEIINLILGLKPDDVIRIADMNGDGIVDVEDVNAIINIILKL
ncbi:MAG: C10 family peptidase [Muribaculaceae bacterium]|nr:C10 family peptidase [Muribaculaceae bacterium]